MDEQHTQSGYEPPDPGPPGDLGDVPDLGIADLEFVREIARGGFGVVYEARQPSLKRTVAVKVMSAKVQDERVRIRFERECKAMGMLSDHPQILTVSDAGFGPEGQPYIVMHFMPGGTLADRVERDGPMPWQETLAIAVKLSAALESAHQAGVLHRDIKPENVLISGYGEPQLADFGIARLQGGPETRTDSLTASIAHVAPELLAGKPPSVQTDLYAFGSTLYVLLSGELAFIRPTDESIVPALSRISSEPVPDLRPQGIPEPVCAIVERLMAKDPGERFESAEALARELQTLQRAMGLPVTPVHIADLPARPPLDPSDTADVSGPLLPSSTGVIEGPPAVTGPQATRPPAEETVPQSLGPPVADGAASAATDKVRPGAPVTVRSEPPPAPEAPAAPAGGRRWWVAAVAAVVVVGLVVGGVLLLRDPEPAADEVADPPAEEPGAEPPDEPGDTDPGTEVVDGVGTPLDVASLSRQVAEVRGLPVRDDIDARRVGSGEYGDLVREHAVRDEAELRAHGRVLAALHLIPRDTDLVALTEDLYAEQFIGFYDERVGTAYVRADAPELSALERSVVSDEVMQALIDQSFDISGLLEDAGDLDARRAVTSLVKGDTFLSSSVWSERFLTSEEQEQRTADIALRPDQVARAAPQAVRAELVFPFIAGEEFARALFAEGGVEALNEAYEDPPTATLHVLDPDRYLAGDQPEAVAIEVDAGADWDEFVSRTFGAFDVQQMLAGIGPEEAGSLARQWRGGALRGWTRGDETALAVRLVVASPEAAEDMCETLQRWYATVVGDVVAEQDTLRGPDDALAVSCAGSDVAFSLAPDPALARALVGAS